MFDHPYTDPGDGRSQCDVCGKFVWEVTHSCKGVRMAPADPSAKHFDPRPIRRPITARVIGTEQTGVTVETCRHGISTDDADAAACAFYEDPGRLVPAGPGRRHPKDELTENIQARVSPFMFARAAAYALEDGMTVSAWVRRLLRDEIARRRGQDQEA